MWFQLNLRLRYILFSPIIKERKHPYVEASTSPINFNPVLTASFLPFFLLKVLFTPISAWQLYACVPLTHQRQHGNPVLVCYLTRQCQHSNPVLVCHLTRQCLRGNPVLVCHLTPHFVRKQPLHEELITLVLHIQHQVPKENPVPLSPEADPLLSSSAVTHLYGPLLTVCSTK